MDYRYLKQVKNNMFFKRNNKVKGETIIIDSQEIELDIKHFSLGIYCYEISDMKELEKLKKLDKLSSVTLSSSNLNDEGLSNGNL